MNKILKSGFWAVLGNAIWELFKWVYENKFWVAVIVSLGSAIWSILEGIAAPIIFVLSLGTLASVLLVVYLGLKVIEAKTVKKLTTREHSGSQRRPIGNSTGGSELEFYETRNDMVTETGGLTNELKEVRTACVAFESGGFFTGVDRALIRRIERMILLDPECDFLGIVAVMQGSTRESYAFRITEATELAISLGIKIRWSDKPILNMVLGYPDSGNDWARIQHQIPHKQAAYWPNIKIDSRRHSRMYSTYKEEFERMWEDAEQPPSKYYSAAGQVGVSMGHDGPVLALSDPYLVEDQTAKVVSDNGDRLHVEMISLWRIDLTNEVEGTEATEVRITVDSEPKLSLLPVKLHEKHDNNPPYREIHRVAYREQKFFDLLGRDSASGMILVYRADSGDEFYVWQLPSEETASQLARDGIKFKVEAFGAAPTKAVERWFMAKADPSGSKLFLTPI